MLIRYLTDDNRIRAAFSVRTGGVSAMPEKSLNLSFSRESSRENVLENYRICAEELGVPFGSLTKVNQVHGKGILKVTAEQRGFGVSKKYDETLTDEENGTLFRFDGMITNVPGITLCTTHADCAPVILWDPENNAAGAVHSGWKGTCLKISAEAVNAMAREYGSRPGKMRAVIGPAIDMDNFEVRRDVYDAFRDAFGEEMMRDGSLCSGPFGEADPKWHVNMPGFVLRTLEAAGIPGNNIFLDCTSTYAHPELFFSHRRDGGRTGAMSTFVVICGEGGDAV